MTSFDELMAAMNAPEPTPWMHTDSDTVPEGSVLAGTIRHMRIRRDDYGNDRWDVEVQDAAGALWSVWCLGSVLQSEVQDCIAQGMQVGDQVGFRKGEVKQPKGQGMPYTVWRVRFIAQGPRLGGPPVAAEPVAPSSDPVSVRTQPTAPTAPPTAPTAPPTAPAPTPAPASDDEWPF